MEIIYTRRVRPDRRDATMRLETKRYEHYYVFFWDGPDIA